MLQKDVTFNVYIIYVYFTINRYRRFLSDFRILLPSQILLKNGQTRSGRFGFSTISLEDHPSLRALCISTPHDNSQRY